MNQLEADDERAGQAAAKLADSLKSCRSIVKSYRLMFAEHPAPEPEPDTKDTPGAQP
jgi:hypothetical protein